MSFFRRLFRRRGRAGASARYHELIAIYRAVHVDGLPEQSILPDHLFIGGSLLPHIQSIALLIRQTNAHTILDYGSGKAKLYDAVDLRLPDGSVVARISDYWGVDLVTPYDPAVPGLDQVPTGQFDGVISTDALEHCPEPDIPWILDEMFSAARLFVFANVAAYPAAKLLPNGENAHSTIKPALWWQAEFHRASRRNRNIPFRLEVVTKTDPRVEGTVSVTNLIG